MSVKQTKDRANQSKLTEGLFRLFIKQTVAVFICTAFILGMKHCGDPTLSSYADSLGYAIRQKTDFEALSAPIISWLEENLPCFFASPDDKDTNTPKEFGDEITFQ